MKNLIFLTMLLGLLGFMSCSDESSLGDSADLINAETKTFTEGRTCNHATHMEELLSDPAYRAEYEERMQKHKSFVSNLLDSRASCSSPVIVPVAVHYQGANNSATLSCLITMAQEQIDALNADYQGTNSDITSYCLQHRLGYQGARSCMTQNHKSLLVQDPSLPRRRQTPSSSYIR